ncbi:MAG: hypothetical protein Unbinned4311contig1001_26 [Prokaryotic dsDNA virus sp.]|nr:MAG: hypothetical protein Unbinned4311contig1001_26 [Prokaryotic dsDNA virus sp.]|tara:strand:+ start:215 stop:439 length:225 start_codon:yes stop_codon:yes gene_type:complete
MAKLNQEIKKLNDKEKKAVSAYQKKLISIVKRNIKKDGFKGENKALYKELNTLTKAIVRSGLSMGVKWLKKNSN